jgi:hypothetical protein
MLNNKTKQEIESGGSLVTAIEKKLILVDKKNAKEIFEEVFENWHEGLEKDRELIDVLGISWNDYSKSIRNDFNHYNVLMKYVKKSNKLPLASSFENSANMIESDLSEENLFEMSNLREKDTGIPYLIWVSAKNANHGARIKVQWGDTIQQSISVSIHKDNPTVVAGNEDKLKKEVIESVKNWIKLNYETLMKYWKMEIGTVDMVNGLKKTSVDSNGKNNDNMLDSDFSEEIKQTNEALKENFHLCLVCGGTGKTKSGQPCKICQAEWRSTPVTSFEQTMVDGGGKDNTDTFAGFDRGWDL